MKIKSMIAGLLAGVLMMGNLSAVCFAAEGAPAPTSGATETETVETAPAETDETAGAASEDGSPALPDGVTLGTKVVLPEGVSIGEDGKITFSAQGMEQIMAALMGGEAGGDTDTAPDTEPETEPEAVTVGTVNVRSDTYLNLRSGSGLEHSVIGHLLRGTEVEVVGEDGDWYQVVIPEATGYVYKDYLDVTEQEAPAAPSEEDGQDAPDPGSGFDEDTLMMLLLMMNMGNTDTAEPPSTALTPDGNLTLVDDYDEAHADGSGKQFITLVTKAGNTFYLIIDRDDEGEQTVHFLNLVDEADLLALMDEEEAAKYTKPEPEVQPPAETQEPEDGEDKPDEEKPAPKANPLPALLLVLALLGGGGFFAYTKFFKGGGKKEQAKPDPDADYLDDDEDYGLPEDIGTDDEDGSGFDAEDDEPV